MGLVRNVYINRVVSCILCFFFNDTATTEIYTLSLHDALPILVCALCCPVAERGPEAMSRQVAPAHPLEKLQERQIGRAHV